MTMFLEIFVGLLASIVIILAYFKVADVYNIVDKPNERSSHSKVTLRGGGIVFPLITALALVLYGEFWYLTAGLILISLISFLDDIKPLRASVRLIFHICSLALMLVQVFDDYPSILVLIASFVICIGAINAYNFMDGINGITGLNTLAILVSIGLINAEYEIYDGRLIAILVTPILVFLFFNFKKKAKCFAGDVGSISMAFIIIFFLLDLTFKTEQYWLIFLLGVYGVDSVLTIVERLFRRENIFKPHRRHLYQLLANEMQLDHRIVSLIYFLIQLGLNLIAILVIKENTFQFLLLLYLAMTLFYIATKFFLLKAIKTTAAN